MSCKYKVIFFFILFCLSAMSAPVMASITIGPNQLIFNLKPGRESSQTVEIKNHSDQLYKIVIEIVDALQEAGNMKFVNPGVTSYSCAAWTTVTPDEITLEGKQTKNVTVKIKSEPGAKGSYHGVVVFVVMPVVESDSKYRVVGQIGAVVLTSVYIEGTLKPKVEVRDVSFTRTPPIRNVSMNVTAQPTAVLTMENTGNCMVDMQGELVIRHEGSNRRVASGSILSINYASPPTIPPGAKRPILIPLNRSIPNGEYIAAANFKYGLRNRLSTKIPLKVGDNLTGDAGEGETEQIQVGFMPQMLDMRLKSGAKRSSAISIINFEKNNIKLSGEIFPLILTSDGEPQIGAQPHDVPSIDQYFEINFVSDELAGGQKGRMVVMVNMPKETNSPGMGVLRLKAETKDGDSIRQSFLYYPLLVSLDEGKPASLEIDSLDYFPAFNEQSPDRVVLTVQNNGENYGLIKGTVELREEAGFVYGSQSYGSEESMLILPGGKREVEILLKPKEHLKPGTNYVLNLQTDIYEESLVRQRRVIKILDKKSQTAAFTLAEDEAGKLMVVIKEDKEPEGEEGQNNQGEQVASGPKE